MHSEMILLPVLVQVFLTISVYVLLNVAKIRATKRGEVDLARRALHDDAWPDQARKINNNIRNQFEVPVLFYVLALALLALNAVGPAALSCAWLFVLSRLAHAYVHVGSNYVPVRRRLFMFGCVLVMALAILTACAVVTR